MGSLTSKEKRTSLEKNTAKKDKTMDIECYGCQENIPFDLVSIKCAQGHGLCKECSKTYIDLMFSEPQQRLPPKCQMCYENINTSLLEASLNLEQTAKFQELMFEFVYSNEKSESSEVEEVVHCPECSYFEIWDKNDSNNALIFHCKKVSAREGNCGKITCFVCKKAYEGSSEEELSEEFDQNHNICAEIAAQKQEFDTILTKGLKIPCPVCGMAGMKDDACLQMTCNNCNSCWCYFCGKKEIDMDKEDSSSRYSHNVNWAYNDKRCPLYLSQIKEIDDRWPEDEKSCLVHLHRLRTLRMLKDFLEKVGEIDFARMQEHFTGVANCGYTVPEILNGDHRLIIR